jgi:hypothetical protein
MQYSSSDDIQAVQSAMSARLLGTQNAAVDVDAIKLDILTNWDKAHMAFPI